MRFDKKVAIITGAGAGMGRAAALAFAKEGAYVFVNDIDEASLNNTANEIRLAGGTVTAIRGDATKRKSVNAVVGKVLEKYGKIDILFNYVGAFPVGVHPQPFTEDTEEVWNGIIDLNIKSTLLFTQAVLGSMIKQKYGKIINTGSGSGRVGAEFMTVYSASKGAVIAFTKALAREVAPHNIFVNCVCPGPIETPGFVQGLKDNPDIMDLIVGSVPLKRMGRSEEVANAVLFLASDEASYMTGQVVSVDGGETMI